MLYLIILVAVVVIVWNVRNNAKLKAEVDKLKAEALTGVAKAETAASNEIKKIL